MSSTLSLYKPTISVQYLDSTPSAFDSGIGSEDRINLFSAEAFSTLVPASVEVIMAMASTP